MFSILLVTGGAKTLKFDTFKPSVEQAIRFSTEHMAVSLLLFF
ncbi:hypothetical protein [Lysinibacillus fusiformis]